MTESLRKQTVRGVMWSAIERFSLQTIQFVINIIMARLLVPSDYGMIGMLMIFLQLSQAFIDCGFANALIQRKNRTEADFSTVFYFNVFISLVLYGILFFSAPLIAAFYKLPDLIPVTRVIALNFVFSSFSAIHKTILTIKVDFKTQSKASLSAALLSGIIGIVMAYAGMGVWSLVYQTILNSVLLTIFLHCFLRWKPLPVFSKTSFRSLFAFGSKLMIAGLINTVYRNLYTLVIGRQFSATNLGYYTRADQFASFPPYNINAIISRVTYPILSSIQDENERLSTAYRKYIQLASFLIFPLMIGLAALAEPVILILLTEKWLGIVSLLQILCLGWMLDHISSINLNLLYVKGHSDWALRLEVIKKTIATIILFASIPFGLEGMCWGRVLYSVIATYLNTHYTKLLIGLTFWQQMKDIFPSLLLSFSMGAVVTLSISYVSQNYLKIIIGTGAGVVFYIAIAYLLKMRSLKDIISLIYNKK